MRTELRHLTDAIRQDWSSDPAARGAAKMTAGTALVAEAVLGLRSRAAAAMWPEEEDGLRRAHGITASILGLLVGIGMVVGGMWAAPAPIPDQVETDGVIVAMKTSGAAEGEILYTPVIEFTDTDGEPHRFTPSYSQSDVPSVGARVRIAYAPGDPAATARRTDGLGARFHLILIGIGLLIALGSLVGLAVRLVMVGVGLQLVRSGRADRAAAGSAREGFLSDLLRLIRSPNTAPARTDVLGTD